MPPTVRADPSTGLRTGSASRIEAPCLSCLHAHEDLVHCVRPSRVFVPAAAPLWYLHNFASQSEQIPASRTCIDKKGGKEATPASSALAARGLPCAARSLRPRQTHFVRCAHCVQTNGAKSVHEARLRARRKALCCSARPKGETNTRFSSLRIGAMTLAVLAPDAKRCGTGKVAKQRPYCSWAPWEASRSAGVWGRVRSTLRQLTSRGCLSAVNEVNAVSSARGPKDRAPQSSRP